MTIEFFLAPSGVRPRPSMSLSWKKEDVMHYWQQDSQSQYVNKISGENEIGADSDIL